MSETVDKEKLTAWQRWELPAFDEKAEAETPKLPTAAEIEELHRQAHEEGYQAGYAEGAARARDEEHKALEARQQANDARQQANEETRRLTEIIGALNDELQRVDEEVAQSLLDLALELSRQMLHKALEVKPELVLEVVQKAIAELPPFNQHAHLILHPDDAELVRTEMGEQLIHAGWKILEDQHMERGGCRIETAHSRVDATLASRWKRMVNSIGQDDTWLKP
jgi:flagellar assembly protein FliH